MGAVFQVDKWVGEGRGRCLVEKSENQRVVDGASEFDARKFLI